MKGAGRAASQVSRVWLPPALLLIPLLWVTPAAAQPVTMSPEAFVAELERLGSEVASGPQGEVPSLRVPAVWVIDTGEQRFEMPAGWLRVEIESARREPSRWPSRRSAIRAQLEALKAEAQALSDGLRTDPAATRGAPRDALAVVLADPEFSGLRRQSVMARVWERISEALLRAWRRLGGARIGRRGTAILFAWMTVLLALGVLGAWLARYMLRPDHPRGLAVGVQAARRRSARAWAHEALNASDPREATRCAYRAAVCGLEEEGAWRADPARTPREHVGLLPHDHRRRAPLGDVARRFEEIWFGARPATEDDRTAVLTRLKELGCLPAE